MLKVKGKTVTTLSLSTTKKINFRFAFMLPERKLWWSALNGDISGARELLRKDTSTEYVDWKAQTPIICAARNGDLDMVQLLLDYGANKEAATCDYGVTALMVAAKGGHFHVVKALVDAGCKLDTASVNGNTASDRAEKQGHTDIALYLNDCLARERAPCVGSLD